MRREVRDAANRVALYLDIGRVHLLDEGTQAAQLNDLDLVLAYAVMSALKP